MACEPPTSDTFILTPGINCATAWTLRAEGNVSHTSREITWVVVAVRTSTTGESPVTTIASSNTPMRMSAFAVAVKDAGSSSPSCRYVLNPVSVNVTI